MIQVSATGVRYFWRQAFVSYGRGNSSDIRLCLSPLYCSRCGETPRQASDPFEFVLIFFVGGLTLSGMTRDDRYIDKRAGPNRDDCRDALCDLADAALGATDHSVHLPFWSATDESALSKLMKSLEEQIAYAVDLLETVKRLSMSGASSQPRPGPEGTVTYPSFTIGTAVMTSEYQPL